MCLTPMWLLLVGGTVRDVLTLQDRQQLLVTAGLPHSPPHAMQHTPARACSLLGIAALLLISLLTPEVCVRVQLIPPAADSTSSGLGLYSVSGLMHWACGTKLRAKPAWQMVDLKLYRRCELGLQLFTTAAW